MPSAGWRASTSHRPPGSSVEKWTTTASPSGSGRRSRPGRRRRVHDHAGRPRGDMRGRSRNVACTTSVVAVDTSSRTSSRPRPAYFGRLVGLEHGSSANRERGADGAACSSHGGHRHRPPRPRSGRSGRSPSIRASEAGHDVVGQRPVGDVLARERVLVHLGAHVAGVDDQHAQRRAARRASTAESCSSAAFDEP